MWIINDMADVERHKKMTVRLSDDEEAMRDLLEVQLGTDGNSVMRQGMLEIARRLGFTFPLNENSPDPKGPGVRKR